MRFIHDRIRSVRVKRSSRTGSERNHLPSYLKRDSVLEGISDKLRAELESAQASEVNADILLVQLREKIRQEAVRYND